MTTYDPPHTFLSYGTTLYTVSQGLDINSVFQICITYVGPAFFGMSVGNFFAHRSVTNPDSHTLQELIM